MFCSNCGNKLSAANKFCNSCGSKITEKGDSQKKEYITSNQGTVEKNINSKNQIYSKCNLYTGLIVIGICIFIALGWIINYPDQFRYNILGDDSFCPCGSSVTQMESFPFYAFFLILLLGLIQVFRSLGKS